MKTTAISLVCVPGNDSIEAWATHSDNHRPYLVARSTDAVVAAVGRMVASDEYEVDFLDLGDVWSVSVRRVGTC